MKDIQSAKGNLTKNEKKLIHVNFECCNKDTTMDQKTLKMKTYVKCKMNCGTCYHTLCLSKLGCSKTKIKDYKRFTCKKCEFNLNEIRKTKNIDSIDTSKLPLSGDESNIEDQQTEVEEKSSDIDTTKGNVIQTKMSDKVLGVGDRDLNSGNFVHVYEDTMPPFSLVDVDSVAEKTEKNRTQIKRAGTREKMNFWIELRLVPAFI